MATVEGFSARRRRSTSPPSFRPLTRPPRRPLPHLPGLHENMRRKKKQGLLGGGAAAKDGPRHHHRTEPHVFSSIVAAMEVSADAGTAKDNTHGVRCESEVLGQQASQPARRCRRGAVDGLAPFVGFGPTGEKLG